MSAIAKQPPSAKASKSSSTDGSRVRQSPASADTVSPEAAGREQEAGGVTSAQADGCELFGMGPTMALVGNHPLHAGPLPADFTFNLPDSIEGAVQLACASSYRCALCSSTKLEPRSLCLLVVPAPSMLSSQQPWHRTATRRSTLRLAHACPSDMLEIYTHRFEMSRSLNVIIQASKLPPCRAWLDGDRMQAVTWPVPAEGAGCRELPDLHFDAAVKLSELMMRGLKDYKGLQGSLAARRLDGALAAGAPLPVLLRRR